MKKFMAVYIGTAESSEKKWSGLSAEAWREREEQGIKAWSEWATKHSNVIKDGGAPLGKTKRVDPAGVSDIRNALTAYTIFEAESHDEAAKLFLNHPHFSIFPGDSVEIMECLPMPGMDK